MAFRKFWIVSELFYPDETSTGYIMTRLANDMSTYPVHVICGPKECDSLTCKSDWELPYKIHRVETINLDKNNPIKRLIRLIFLSSGMFLRGFFLIRKKDNLLIVTNPAFIVPFYALISRLKGSKLFILVHDVFPENLIPANLIKSDRSFLFRVARSIFNWSYRQADHLIVLGRDMKDVMEKKAPNTSISVIENWADIERVQPGEFLENPLIKQFQLEQKIVFTFAGNIGRVQGLEFLFNVIKQVSNKEIHFLFIGSGALLESLKKDIEASGIKFVTFAGAMQRSQQNTFLNAAHFGLVTLSSRLYGLGVPSKSYNIMAAGKPILFIGDKNTEIAKMVIESDCGYVFDENDEASLVSFFNELEFSNLANFKKMGVRARKLAEARYSEKYILGKFKDTLLG
ncbi:MAG TPA: glycosyltransferase family 4 protein [Pedobacter sp.]|jgi:glycosyltransferase involved in cell wall biosynthesis